MKTFSTLSANLNCLAGTIYEDFLSKILTKRNSHKTAGFILKLVVIVAGIVSTMMVYVVEHLGGLLALTISLGSVAHGPLLGMFTMGMLFPRANSKVKYCICTFRHHFHFTIFRVHFGEHFLPWCACL